MNYSAKPLASGPKTQAVFFDFGGVVLTSPFDAFNEYERSMGIPKDSIRTINATNPDDNAWAKFERSDVDDEGFAHLFEAEAVERGLQISGHKVLSLISGDVRPQMVDAIRRIKSAGFLVACLTNNFRRSVDESANEPRTERDDSVGAVMAMFDYVVESSVVGVRKPELQFYERALEITGADADSVVFLDDLGINLKPAKAMGMTTIKVIDPDVALAELEKVLGISLTGAAEQEG